MELYKAILSIYTTDSVGIHLQQIHRQLPHQKVMVNSVKSYKRWMLICIAPLIKDNFLQFGFIPTHIKLGNYLQKQSKHLALKLSRRNTESIAIKQESRSISTCTRSFVNIHTISSGYKLLLELKTKTKLKTRWVQINNSDSRILLNSFSHDNFDIIVPYCSTSCTS